MKRGTRGSVQRGGWGRGRWIAIGVAFGLACSVAFSPRSAWADDELTGPTLETALINGAADFIAERMRAEFVLWLVDQVQDELCNQNGGKNAAYFFRFCGYTKTLGDGTTLSYFTLSRALRADVELLPVTLVAAERFPGKKWPAVFYRTVLQLRTSQDPITVLGTLGGNKDLVAECTTFNSAATEPEPACILRWVGYMAQAQLQAIFEEAKGGTKETSTESTTGGVKTTTKDVAKAIAGVEAKVLARCTRFIALAKAQLAPALDANDCGAATRVGGLALELNLVYSFSQMATSVRKATAKQIADKTADLQEVSGAVATVIGGFADLIEQSCTLIEAKGLGKCSATAEARWTDDLRNFQKLATAMASGKSEAAISTLAVMLSDRLNQSEADAKKALEKEQAVALAALQKKQADDLLAAGTNPSATLVPEQQQALQKLKDTQVEALKDLPQQLTARKSLKRFLVFVGQMSSVKTADDAKQMFDDLASPVGAWRYKRQGKAAFSVGALGGVYGGPMTIDGEKGGKTTTRPAKGFFAPVGIDFSWPMGSASTVGLFVSAIDLGALVASSFDEDGSNKSDTKSVKNPTQVKMDQVYAPGLFLRFGLGRSPFVLGAGYQNVPKLVSVTNANDKETIRGVNRTIAFLAFDIPILPMY